MDDQPPSRSGMPRDLAAIVLAAGYSSRMGDFKPLLPVGGQPAIDCAVHLFRDAGIDDVSVVVGHRADDLGPAVQRLGVRAVVNPAYHTGMYSSVVAGIAAVADTVGACFVLPVDIPLVRPATVASIVRAYRVGTPAVLYPVFAGRRGHPPLLSSTLFPEILTGNGIGGLRALLDRHDDRAAEVDVFDEGVLLDMDRPNDYRRMMAYAARRHVPSVAECEAILAAMVPDVAVARHCRAVAAVADALTVRLVAAGAGIDRDLVRAGSLLHDLAKGSAHHAEVGAQMVETLGFPDVARVVGRHMEAAFDGEDLDEGAIVYVADKLVRGDHVVTLEERFGGAFARFRDDPPALRAARARYETATAILRAVEQRAATPWRDMLADTEPEVSL